jgi:CHAD domain-containing protein
LKEFQRNLATKKQGQGGWDEIAKGLKKSYRKARASLRLAEASGVDESFHEARKRVKDLFYHVTLVELADPEKLPELQKRLLKLQGLLGKDHDVAIAREVLLHAKTDHVKAYEAALKKLRERTDTLRKRIHRHADRLFDADTKALLRKAGEELKKWPLAAA